MAVKFCPNCGNKLVENQKFCTECGTQISQEQTVSIFEDSDAETLSKPETITTDEKTTINEYYSLLDNDQTEKKSGIKAFIISKWYIFVAALVVIVLLCIGLSMCSKSAVTKETQEETKEYGIGDTIKYNDVSITLESVERYDTTFSDHQPDAGKEYILLWFTVDNAGDEDFSFSSFLGDESLCDGEDVSSGGISPFGLDDEMGEKIMATIVAGDKKYGYAMYEVNQNFEKFEFIFDPTPMDIGEMGEEIKPEDDDNIIFKFDYSEVGEATTQFSNSKYGLKSLEDVKDIYTFTLEGKTYTLPFDAKELFDLGWECELVDHKSYTLDSATYSSFYIKKDNARISVSIANTTNETAILNDCMVIEIGVTGESGVAFETADGFKIGDSYKTVYDKYGAEEYSGADGGTGDKKLQYNFIADLFGDQRLERILRTNNYSDELSVSWDGYDNITSISMNLVMFD